MSLLAQVRITLLLAFKSLPLLLIGFIGFLAIGLGNMGLFMLFIGHAVLVPIVTEISHALTNSPSNLTTYNDVSQLVPVMPANGASFNMGPVNVVPSYWMAHISFFFGYILMNAVMIYVAVPHKTASPAAVASRKSRAATLIATSVILLVTLTMMRISLTGNETFTGVTVAVLALGFAGVGWYKLAEVCGARNSDIFGIAQQMVSQDTAASKPVTCVYAPTAR
jgi:hypothetical protein